MMSKISPGPLDFLSEAFVVLRGFWLSAFLIGGPILLDWGLQFHDAFFESFLNLIIASTLVLLYLSHKLLSLCAARALIWQEKYGAGKGVLGVVTHPSPNIP